jgi:hypothetical protein
VIIAQIVLTGASEYERKSQRADREALSADHQIVVVDDPRAVTRADVAHVYAPPHLPRSLFRDFRIPFVSSGRLARRRFPFGRSAEPRTVVGPVAGENIELLAEAVESAYWDATRPPREPGNHRLGSFARDANQKWIEQTVARIHRTREDVDWLLFDHPPSPVELAGVDVWIDPATRDDDYDGFVAEAMVAGVPVIGGRTPLNVQRMERGRTGVLVPPGDANEMTHAILTVLFKPESVQPRLSAAQQTISKFRPRQRLRALLQMYENVAR